MHGKELRHVINYVLTTLVNHHDSVLYVVTQYQTLTEAQLCSLMIQVKLTVLWFESVALDSHFRPFLLSRWSIITLK